MLGETANPDIDAVPSLLGLLVEGRWLLEEADQSEIAKIEEAKKQQKEKDDQRIRELGLSKRPGDKNSGAH
jgi:hypothetical protein